MLQYSTRIFYAKLSLYYFAYLIFSLWFYKSTIARFIADDKVGYQGVKRVMRLALTTAEHNVV